MKIVPLILILVFTISCSNEKTDAYLLQLDKDNLKEDLKTSKVGIYKFGKLCIRTSVADEESRKELGTVAGKLFRTGDKIVRFQEDPKSISAREYLEAYKDYTSVKEYVETADEDDFPTLLEIWSKSINNQMSNQTYLEGKPKEFLQSGEHAILSGMVLPFKSLGKEISLYECYKTNPEILPDGEFKTIINWYRGLLFFEKGYLYLSEDELSRNIDFLNDNPEIDMPLVATMFEDYNATPEQTYYGFRGMNHLIRGLDRSRMEREIDEERSLDDYEAFLRDAKTFGLDNELVWSVETYLYLKREESDKAIASLKKLKTSSFLSSDEKKSIDQSIGYLKERKSEKVLNGFFDKAFLGKLVASYILSQLAQLDWEQILEDQGVPNTREIFASARSFMAVIQKIENYSSTEGLKKTGDDLKKEGDNLWEKAKSLME